MKKAEFLVITGMSGAGKSFVLKVLEDWDFFCIDNLPPALIPKFAELYQQMDWHKNVALVLDIRLGSFFDQLTAVFQDFAKAGFEYDLLFLDCSDEKLIRRYKETRRRHPLAVDDRISNGISLEREALSRVRELSTVIIDTSDMTTAQLKEKVAEIFLKEKSDAGFNITVVSFGFKFGIPADADMVIDVRFLDNPFYVEGLRYKNGNDKEVANYIMQSPVTGEFLAKQGDLIDFLLPQFVKEGKLQLVIGIGCTGGMHRSVFVASVLAERLKVQGYKVRKEDRDLAKNVKPLA
jgi:UPF0042 nucleotide-binding protein